MSLLRIIAFYKDHIQEQIHDLNLDEAFLILICLVLGIFYFDSLNLSGKVHKNE